MAQIWMRVNAQLKSRPNQQKKYCWEGLIQVERNDTSVYLKVNPTPNTFRMLSIWSIRVRSLLQSIAYGPWYILYQYKDSKSTKNPTATLIEMKDAEKSIYRKQYPQTQIDVLKAIITIFNAIVCLIDDFSYLLSKGSSDDFIQIFTSIHIISISFVFSFKKKWPVFLMKYSLLLFLFISSDLMHQSLRKISGGFDANFQLVESSLIINITHPLKNRVYFSRLSDKSLPKNIVQIADTTKELYELIIDLNEDKMVMNADDALVIMVDVGRKVKQYMIPMEKVDISMEESLKKRVADLEKELEKKQFEAKFFKEQYQFLLQHLQLKPNVEQLERIYQKDIGTFFVEKDARLGKSQSMFESQMTMSSISSKSQKVGSFEKPQKQPLKCVKLHPLLNQPTTHAYYKCNICRRQISQGQIRYHCRPCDFDACGNCISIPPQNRKYCPKQHGLEFGCAKNYLVRSCDICRASLAFTKAYTCLECDYDICKNCLK